MDLQGFTTIDEVGDDDETSDKEVRENLNKIFSPNSAAEEIDYLNKIILDMEKDSSIGEHVGRNNANSGPSTETELMIQTESVKSVVGKDYNVNKLISVNDNSLNVNSNICITDNTSQLESVSIENKHSVGNEDLVSDCDKGTVIVSCEEKHLKSAYMTEPVNIAFDKNSKFKELKSDDESDKCDSKSVDKNDSSEQSETNILLEKCPSQSLNSVSHSENVLKNNDSLQENTTVNKVIAKYSININNDETKEKNADDKYDNTSSNDNDYINISLPLRISCIKTEPVEQEASEDVDFGEYFNDPAEEDFNMDSNIKEELDSENLLTNEYSDHNIQAVGITKFELPSDDDEQSSVTSFIPKVHYRIEKKKIYSKEQLTAAVIMAQFSIASVINMNMFDNLSKSMPSVPVIRLENLCPSSILIDDYEAADVFFVKYGRNPKKWKKYFKIRKIKKPVEREKESRKSSSKQPKKNKKGLDNKEMNIKILKEKYREAINRTLAQNVEDDHQNSGFGASAVVSDYSDSKLQEIKKTSDKHSKTSHKDDFKTSRPKHKDKSINNSLLSKNQLDSSKEIKTPSKKKSKHKTEEKLSLIDSKEVEVNDENCIKITNICHIEKRNKKDTNNQTYEFKPLIISKHAKDDSLKKKHKNDVFKSLLNHHKIKPCSVILSREAFPQESKFIEKTKVESKLLHTKTSKHKDHKSSKQKEIKVKKSGKCLKDVESKNFLQINDNVTSLRENSISLQEEDDKSVVSSEFLDKKTWCSEFEKQKSKSILSVKDQVSSDSDTSLDCEKSSEKCAVSFSKKNSSIKLDIKENILDKLKYPDTQIHSTSGSKGHIEKEIKSNSEMILPENTDCDADVEMKSANSETEKSRISVVNINSLLSTPDQNSLDADKEKFNYENNISKDDSLNNSSHKKSKSTSEDAESKMKLFSDDSSNESSFRIQPSSLHSKNNSINKASNIKHSKNESLMNVSFSNSSSSNGIDLGDVENFEVGIKNDSIETDFNNFNKLISSTKSSNEVNEGEAKENTTNEVSKDNVDSALHKKKLKDDELNKDAFQTNLIDGAKQVDSNIDSKNSNKEVFEVKKNLNQEENLCEVSKEKIIQDIKDDSVNKSKTLVSVEGKELKNKDKINENEKSTAVSDFHKSENQDNIITNKETDEKEVSNILLKKKQNLSELEQKENLKKDILHKIKDLSKFKSKGKYIKKCYVLLEDLYYNKLYRKKIKREKKYWAKKKHKTLNIKNIDIQGNSKIKTNKEKSLSIPSNLEKKKEISIMKTESSNLKENLPESGKTREQDNLKPVEKKKGLTEVPLLGLTFKIPKKTVNKAKHVAKPKSLIQRNESMSSSYYEQNKNKKKSEFNNSRTKEGVDVSRDTYPTSRNSEMEEGRPKVFLNFNPELYVKDREREKQGLSSSVSNNDRPYYRVQNPNIEVKQDRNLNSEKQAANSPVSRAYFYDRLKNSENPNMNSPKNKEQEMNMGYRNRNISNSMNQNTIKIWENQNVNPQNMQQQGMKYLENQHKSLSAIKSQENTNVHSPDVSNINLRQPYNNDKNMPKSSNMPTFAESRNNSNNVTSRQSLHTNNNLTARENMNTVLDPQSSQWGRNINTIIDSQQRQSRRYVNDDIDSQNNQLRRNLITVVDSQDNQIRGKVNAFDSQNNQLKNTVGDTENNYLKENVQPYNTPIANTSSAENNEKENLAFHNSDEMDDFHNSPADSYGSPGSVESSIGSFKQSSESLVMPNVNLKNTIDNSKGMDFEKIVKGRIEMPPSNIKESTNSVADESETSDFIKKIESLDKKGKIKLYIKYKSLYNVAKKKFYDEPGDMHKNTTKFRRYRELNMRRKMYYDLKLYLYEQKKQKYVASKKDQIESSKHEPESSNIKLKTASIPEAKADDLDEPYSPSSSPLLSVLYKEKHSKPKLARIELPLLPGTSKTKVEELKPPVNETEVSLSKSDSIIKVHVTETNALTRKNSDGEEPYSPSWSPVNYRDITLPDIKNKAKGDDNQYIESGKEVENINTTIKERKSKCSKDNEYSDNECFSPPGSPLIPTDVNCSFLTSTSALTDVLQSFVEDTEICKSENHDAKVAKIDKNQESNDNISIDLKPSKVNVSSNLRSNQVKVSAATVTLSPVNVLSEELKATHADNPAFPKIDSSNILLQPSVGYSVDKNLGITSRPNNLINKHSIPSEFPSPQQQINKQENIYTGNLTHSNVYGSIPSLPLSNNAQYPCVIPGQPQLFMPTVGVHLPPLSSFPNNPKPLPCNPLGVVQDSKNADLKNINLSLATALLLPPPPPPPSAIAESSTEKIQNNSKKIEEVRVSCSPQQDGSSFASIISDFFENWQDPTANTERPHVFKNASANFQPKEDFEIIYTNVTAKKNEFIEYMDENLYEKKALAQPLIDKVEGIPLVGLQYVLEVQKEGKPSVDSSSYICSLCSKKMSSATLIAHVKSVPHRLKFIEFYCPDLHEKFGKMEVKQWTAALVKEFTCSLQEFEKTAGRQRLAVTLEKSMNSAVNFLKNSVNAALKNEGPVSVPIEPFKTDTRTKEVPIKSSTELNSRSSRSHTKESLSPKSGKRAYENDRPGPKSSKVSRFEPKERETDKDREREKEKEKQREKEKNRERERDRENRSKAHRKDNSPLARPSPNQRHEPYIRTSRTRSPLRSDRPPPFVQRKDENTLANERKLMNFRADEIRVKNEAQGLMDQFIKDPESHPRYKAEWERFWDRRYREVREQGSDIKFFDFKKEWLEFWPRRLQELCTNEFKNRREELLSRYRIEDPDPDIATLFLKLPQDFTKTRVDKRDETIKSNSPNVIGKYENRNINYIDKMKGRNDRSSSPWERYDKSRLNKNKDFSDEMYETGFSVVGTLKILTNLEDQLGSLYPGTKILLKKAVDIAEAGGKPLNLFENNDNLGILRLASVKLSSLISSGILGIMTAAKTQRAIESINWILKESEKFSPNIQSSRIASLGLDLNLMSTATIGMNTMQIAQYIAQQLFNIGKSDVDESVLQEILMAISESHTQYKIKSQPEYSSNISEFTHSVKEHVHNYNPNQQVDLRHQRDIQYDHLNEGNIKQGPSFSSVPALFPSGAAQKAENKIDKVPESSISTEKPKNSALTLLQSAYDHDDDGSKEKDMDKLSLEELQELLSNFKNLSSQEQQNLTNYLKKLEATDNKKVTKLRSMMQNTKPIIQRIHQNKINIEKSTPTLDTKNTKSNVNDLYNPSSPTYEDPHAYGRFPQERTQSRNSFSNENFSKSSNDPLQYGSGSYDKYVSPNEPDHYSGDYEADSYDSKAIRYNTSMYSDNVGESNFSHNRQPLLTTPMNTRSPVPKTFHSRSAGDDHGINTRKPLLSNPTDNQFLNQPKPLLSEADLDSRFPNSRKPLLAAPGAKSFFSGPQQNINPNPASGSNLAPRQALLPHPGKNAFRQRDDDYSDQHSSQMKESPEESNFYEQEYHPNANKSSYSGRPNDPGSYAGEGDSMANNALLSGRPNENPYSNNRRSLLPDPEETSRFQSKEYRIGSNTNDSRPYNADDRDRFAGNSGFSSSFSGNQSYGGSSYSDNFNEQDYEPSRKFSDRDISNQDQRENAPYDDGRPSFNEQRYSMSERDDKFSSDSQYQKTESENFYNKPNESFDSANQTSKYNSGFVSESFRNFSSDFSRNTSQNMYKPRDNIGSNQHTNFESFRSDNEEKSAPGRFPRGRGRMGNRF